jgi:hypothetical protein
MVAFFGGLESNLDNTRQESQTAWIHMSLQWVGLVSVPAFVLLIA